MTEPTYGELIDRAGMTMAHAMSKAIDTNGDVQVMALAHRLEPLRRAICRHAELALDPGHSPNNCRDVSTDALAAALRPSWLPGREENGGSNEPDSAWAQAGRYLGAAGDLLATHFGPHGRHLTDDAARLVDAEGRRELLRDAARFADTMAEYAIHVAGRVADEPHGEGVHSVVAAWFEHGGDIRSTAYAVLNDTDAAREPDLLGALGPAPLLRREPVADLEDAFPAYNRLRRLSHAQAVGDIRADANALRGFAVLGYTITGYANVVHAAAAAQATALGLDKGGCEHHRGDADRLKQANATWGQLHAALACVRDAGGGPVGWRDDVLGIQDQLGRLIRQDHRLRPPAELMPDLVTARSLINVIDRFTPGLPGIATGQRDCARRLYRRGQLHVPTCQLESADIPRPYTTIPGPRFDEMLAAYSAASDVTRDALEELARPDVRRDVRSTDARLAIAQPRTRPHALAAETSAVAR